MRLTLLATCFAFSALSASAAMLQTVSWEFPASQVTNVVFRIDSTTNVTAKGEPMIVFAIEFIDERPFAFYRVGYIYRTNVTFRFTQSAPSLLSKPVAGFKEGKLQ